MMPTSAAPPPTARLNMSGVHWTSSPARRSVVTPRVIAPGQMNGRHESASRDCCIFPSLRSEQAPSRAPRGAARKAFLDDLRTLRRLRLRHGLVEPDLVTVGIHH